ncbi:sugar porter family MFS transporter [Niabella drilacis]|uniref:MFS transporter, sugar porter (SP) family n=1 Tax=Niabella drilacis (strain DSM 25811 / CCM 8410 / CCUG 62505 / LMG 26954 / E90) TaxID=1285928 RepID=A0A1G6S599_NIADE|nr:sugar porter family MFS transporter [Niabella drilacis]SDD12029.1 MFS transporter, sugar porter (SP) family [Niabella drilacis]
MQINDTPGLVAKKGINLFGISLIAALAGFIFGFDTVVISGANQPIKDLWHTTDISPWFHGIFIMSMALWGTVLGAVLGGRPTERYGRKKVLLWIGIFFSVSAIGSALAQDPYTFSVFRFIGGVGIGVSSVAAPTYISEISTPQTRGRLGAMYQFNIVFGILIAYLSNYFLQGVGGVNDWRWMLGVMAVPSLLYTVLVLGIPESPRWLVARKKDDAQAANVLERLGVADAAAAVKDIKENAALEAAAGGTAFFSKKYSRIIWLAFFVAFFNQWSGINFILYYAPEILERAGLASKESLLNSIAIGGTNLIFTFVGLYLIDRIGRKTLLILGSIGYIISLAMVAYAFYAHAGAAFLLSSLLLFIAAHAIGQGAVIWVFISEIFPNRIRALGQSFGASTHWVFAAIITLIVPVFLDAKTGVFKDNPWPIFAFFAFMMLLQLVWVLVKVPETKGVSLEDLEKKLVEDRL